MKIYFDATPSKIDLYRENYRLIGNLIGKMGHELTSRWILDFDESFYKMARGDWKKHYRKIISSLSKADIVIVEISVSSTSIGQLIQQALIWKKPVIALRNQKDYHNIFLEGAGDVESKLLVVEYSMENLETELRNAIEYMEDWLESRFTMLMPSEIVRYLNKIAEKGVSRSGYIRKLIKKEMARRR